jgi:hypothetical protein
LARGASLEAPPFSFYVKVYFGRSRPRASIYETVYKVYWVLLPQSSRTPSTSGKSLGTLLEGISGVTGPTFQKNLNLESGLLGIGVKDLLIPVNLFIFSD